MDHSGSEIGQLMDAPRQLAREDVRVPDSKADVYLVGIGIGGFDQRSVRADAILRTCSLIGHLTAFDDDLKASYDADILDLKPLYESENDASSVYDEISETLVAAASGYLPYGPVAFVWYGNPLWLVDCSWDVIRAGESRGWKVKAVPGTSFLDHVIGDLGLRLDYGCQVYEAEWLFRRQVATDPAQPLVVTQFGSFGTSELRARAGAVERLAPLIELLQSRYPADRNAHLIMSSWRSDMAPQITTVPIGELAVLAPETHPGVSLVIEGV